MTQDRVAGWHSNHSGGEAAARSVLLNSSDALHWVLDRLGVQVLEELPGLRPLSGTFGVTSTVVE